MESILGKHSLDLVIQQTNSVDEDFLKVVLPSYVALDEHTENQAKLLGIKKGGSYGTNRSFSERVNAAAVEPQKKEKVKKYKHT